MCRSIEPPDTAYVEATGRTGDVLLASFRDASLLNNIDGARKAIMKAQDVAVDILKNADIYAP